MDKITAKFIIEEIGAQTIADCLGVGLHSVRNAKFTGEFPANWFDALEQLCISSGVKCPRVLFTFRPPLMAPAKKRGNGSTHIQGKGSESTTQVQS